MTAHQVRGGGVTMREREDGTWECSAGCPLVFMRDEHQDDVKYHIDWHAQEAGMTDTVTVNEEALEQVIDEFLADYPYFDFTDWEDFDHLMVRLTDSAVFDLPDGAYVTAFSFDEDPPGFIFGMRPSRSDDLGRVDISTFFIESVDIEPRDEEGRLPVDGAFFTLASRSPADIRKAFRQLADNVATELTVLLPAYKKLWE